MAGPSTVRVYNILLLGATGMGKSTLVNAIANYFTYETLEEAIEANEPICVIPTTFAMTLNNFKDINIVIRGINSFDMNNEDHSGASSCTQEPRVYSFYDDEVGFNVIDIPGIGDTAGIFKDSKNKKIIADKIKEFTEIHGIFILFKAYDARLTTAIQYNLNETLMMLHKNAIKNIMFVITTSRGADYHPGDSMSTLKRYVKELKEEKGINIELNENTIFCLDNEAYIYQCGWNKSEDYREEFGRLYHNYTKSWEVSRKIVFQLFERMYTLRGHNVELTCAVGQARAIIHCAVGPLATITALIQKALTPASREANIKSLTTNGLQSKDEIVIESAHPQTVCTDKNCVEFVLIPGSNQYAMNLKTVCHDVCYLKKTKATNFLHNPLEDCEAFDQYGICHICGCSVDKHIHINVKHKQKQTMNKVSSKPLTHQEAEKFIDSFIQKQKKEQDVIISAIVKLSLYLKQNAILEYNNAFEERIKVDIRKEQATMEATGNKSSAELIEKLETALKQYKYEMKAIDTSIKAGRHQKVTEDDVKELMASLLSLPINGENIRKLYEAESSQNQTSPEIKTVNSRETLQYRVKYLP